MDAKEVESVASGEGVEVKQGQRRDVSYEDAIALAGHGKFHFGLLLVCGGCITATICELLGVGYLLPAAQCDLEMTDADKGLLGSMAFIGMLFGSHLWGFLADTTGRRSVVCITLFVDVVIAVLSAIVPSYWIFLVLRFLAGFFVTAPQAVGYAYLGEFHTPSTRAKAFVWAAVFPAIGLIYLPGVGWWILPQTWSLSLPWMTVHSWRLYVVLCAVPSLITFLGMLLLPESPKYLLGQGRGEEALAVLQRVFGANTGRPRHEYPVESLAAPDDSSGRPATGVNPKSVLSIFRSVWAQTAPLFTMEHLLSTFLALFIMFGIIAGANGLPTWLPELFNRMAMYETSHPGQSASVCGSILGLIGNASSAEGAPGPGSEECVAVVETDVFVNNLYVGVAGVIAPVLSVFLVGPLGKRTLLILSLMLTGACGLGLKFVGSSLGFLVLACIVCAITEMCISLFSSVAVEMFPTNLRAMAVSLSLMCGRLGSIVGNLMFGSLLESACPATFYALGGVLIGTGRFHLMLLLISGSTITCTTSEILGPSYLLPAAACDLRMSDLEKGILGAIVYIGMIFGSHFWGYLADTRGRRSIIRLTLFADAAVAVLAAFSPNFATFVTLKFFSGFFMTAPQAVAYAYLGEFHSPDNRARAFVWAGVFPALGLLLLPAVGWLVLPRTWSLTLPLIGEARSWRLYVVLCAVPSLLTALGFCLLPESPKYLLGRGRDDEALRVLQRVFSVNSGRPEAEYPVSMMRTDALGLPHVSLSRSLLQVTGLMPATSEADTKSSSKQDPGLVRSVWNQTAPLFTCEHLLSTFLSLFIMFGIIAGANGLPTWLPELFNRMALWEHENPGQSTSICASVEGLLHGDATEAPAQCTSTVEEAVFINNLYLGVAALLAPVLSVYTVVPLGKRNLLILSLLLTGACGVALDLARSSAAFMALSCVVVAVTEMCISLFSSVVVDMFPTHLRAMAVSLSLMAGRCGSIAGNFMFGALLEAACPATFYALGGVLLGA
ncbi:Synaptic vesicle glycoprotein 2B [Frankliniella fusca]|uniref:Synaptic vesicle glycoprotein 2B n=1 Tax=Frankliniella fusca TaxID=407009 RepID=A0AAE1L893_9NEOP|nr:Synaptic vesicle glycoprotein 2B [Frankliniella fusca]